MHTPYASGFSSASANGRDEWLLDDAIDDTFPASDPVSHSQPGSIVNRRYAAREHRARTARHRRTDRTLWWLTVGAVVGTLLLIGRRRGLRDTVR